MSEILILTPGQKKTSGVCLNQGPTRVARGLSGAAFPDLSGVITEVT
jgi:hypothetical protein